METKQIRRSYSKAGFIAIIAVVAQVVVGVSASLLLPPTDNAYITLLLPLVLSYVISIPIIWLLTRRGAAPEQMPTKYKIPAGKLCAWFLAAFGVSRLALMITTLLQTAIAGEVVTDAVTELQMQNPWMMFVLASVVAPITEELIFRGFLYKVLAPYGGKYYVLVSALLFALFHVNVSQIPFAFVLGLFFAYVMYRTGDIRLPMLLHFITNVISSISVLLLGSDIGILLTGLVVMLLIAVGVIVAIVLLVTGRVKRDVVFEPATIAPAKAGQVFINAGMILSVLGLLAFTVLNAL